MLEFQSIELSDKEWIDDLLKRSDFRTCEYNFNTMFLWRFVFQTRISRHEDRLLVRSYHNGKYTYLFPAGSGDLKEAVALLMDDAKDRGDRFRMHSVSEQGKTELELAFPGALYFFPSRRDYDYIYTAESLRTLKGKKLHGKRNHIHRFLDQYQGRYSYEPITGENIHECMQMNKEWCRLNDCLIDESKLQEQCSVAQAFRHYSLIGLEGGLLRVDGKVIAFTMGEPLNSDTFLVHIEKAMAQIQGAYPMINQQFVLDRCDGFSYVNREDDSGMEGLRKAKLSYRPAFLEKKYLVFLKDQLTKEEVEEMEKQKALLEEPA